MLDIKKIFTFIITTIFINCYAQQNSITDYSGYSISELNSKKIELELKVNYVLVNDYLEKIERGDVDHMALTKIDNGIVKPYWDSGAELKPNYNNWKEAVSRIVAFKKTHAPELQELNNLLKNKIIDKEMYFSENRKIREQLHSRYPNEYPLLAANHISSLKTMWKATGRYMLEDYKRKEKNFPIYWIPEKERIISKNTNKYKAITQELIAVQNEIKKNYNNK